MKVFAIRNEEESSGKDLGYLIYYEKGKRFYIELPEDADEWETPLLLSSFLKRDERTVNAYFSRLWVQQRIVPADRQNLGRILRENGLSEYDEYGLLMLAGGRCAQDSYYLAAVDASTAEVKFKERYKKKVEDAVPLQKNRLLVFFRDGKVKKCDVSALVGDNRFFGPVLSSETVFRRVAVQIGGYGVRWSETAEISDRALYEAGEEVPLSRDDFIRFISDRVIGSAEAAELLACSRQNIHDLTRHKKLHPVKTEQKATFFLKSEVLQRMWS